MSTINKIIIGATTGENPDTIKGFIRSFWANCEEVKCQIILVVNDVGTPGERTQELRDFCKEWGAHYILGLEKSWADIATFDKEADLVIFCSSTLRFIAPGWLTRIIHAYESNPDLSFLTFPIIAEGGYNDDAARWNNPPHRGIRNQESIFAARTKDVSAFAIGSAAHLFSCVLPYPPIWDAEAKPTEIIEESNPSETFQWLDRENKQQEAII